MRRIKRLKDLDIALEIKNEEFVRPPRDTQRNWLVNRALDELVQDLGHLHVLASEFVTGSEVIPLEDRTGGQLGEQDIMEDWQIPIMKKMAAVATENGGNVLEIGFGRGIASTYIQELNVSSHTIVECNESVVDRFYQWKQGFADRDIRLIQGKWQEVTDEFGTYDGIFFHTYPLNQEEYFQFIAQSTTLAESFFPVAASHLREGGIFTYLTNEIDSFSRSHQRLVFEHFSSLTLSIVKPLNLPNDVRDAWWANSMVTIKAIK